MGMGPRLKQQVASPVDDIDWSVEEPPAPLRQGETDWTAWKGIGTVDADAGWAPTAARSDTSGPWEAYTAGAHEGQLGVETTAVAEGAAVMDAVFSPSQLRHQAGAATTILCHLALHA
jgi:hypothetical protein